jgi:CYTH domain-containing protein
LPVEIERKFLVIDDAWHDGQPGQRFCQGYIAQRDGVTVRVRRAGPRAFVTIKGEANGIVRPEFEYEVPVDEAEQMLAGLCRRPLIEKTRYEVCITATFGKSMCSAARMPGWSSPKSNLTIRPNR